MKSGLRYLFNLYGRVCLLAGVALLSLLGLLGLFKLGLDWQNPLVASEWFTFATGLIVLAISIGPYVITVGQLAKIQRSAHVQVQTSSPLSQERKRWWWLAGSILSLGSFLAIVSSRSFMIWFTCGSLFILLGLALFYIAWQIGRIEKTANMVIYAQDYSWRFDQQSYFGVLNNPARTTNR